PAGLHHQLRRGGAERARFVRRHTIWQRDVLTRSRGREPNVADVVIVEAVRTPTGRRNGGLSTVHSIDLLGAVQRDLFIRTGADPLEIGQVVGGCVAQIGMQAMNVTRNAWLAAGLPIEVAATTVDSQCGSSQQATNL